MPQTKRPFLRFQVIDRELSRIAFRKVKTSYLQDLLLEEFDIKVSVKTLQTDLEAMKYDTHLGYQAPIEYDKKAKAYYYSDPDYSIHKFGLKEEEINSLAFMLNVFRQYSQHGIFKGFVSAIEKIDQSIQIERNTHLSNKKIWDKVIFDLPFSKDHHTAAFFPLILQAMDQQKRLHFSYQKFDDSAPSRRDCIPAWLKEYNGLWYLIAEEQNGMRKTFALDRMSEISIATAYGKAEEIDILAYYQYLMGITSHGKEPVLIEILCAPQQAPYIKAAPIHGTQQVLSENEEGLRVSICVVPTYELYAKLRSYGSTIKILSPQQIRETLKKDLQACLENYS